MPAGETGTPRNAAPTRGNDTHGPVLEVQNLKLSIGGAVTIVDDLSLRIERGEILALVGESGSGKSLTARALVQLLPRGVVATGGEIEICGEKVHEASPAALRRLRGSRVGMIFQQPRSMLDPTCRVAPQVGEVLRLHRGASRSAAWARSVELLRDVGIPEPEHWARGYAHQLSGGMAQRVMIASALSGDPDLLIADEPTTALDVTVQAQILQLLARERRERNLSILLITHDLSVVSVLADRIAVIYAGRVVEQGRAADVLQRPQHPYTAALIRCSLMQDESAGGLYSIPETVPRPGEHIPGCRFHPRCDVCSENGLTHQCAGEVPEPRACGQEHWVACWAGAAGGAPEP